MLNDGQKKGLFLIVTGPFISLYVRNNPLGCEKVIGWIALKIWLDGSSCHHCINLMNEAQKLPSLPRRKHIHYGTKDSSVLTNCRVLFLLSVCKKKSLS